VPWSGLQTLATFQESSAVPLVSRLFNVGLTVGARTLHEVPVAFSSKKGL